MSIRSLTDLAVDRDLASPASSVTQFSGALTSAIPTESLTAYTAFIAVVQSVATPQASYLPARWWAFGGFVGVTAFAVVLGYYRKLAAARTAHAHPGLQGRWVPLELLPALAASAAWGLAMPGGPLSVVLTGAAHTLATAAIIVGGGALVALATAPLPQATTEAVAAGDGALRR